MAWRAAIGESSNQLTLWSHLQHSGTVAKQIFYQTQSAISLKNQERVRFENSK